MPNLIIYKHRKKSWKQRQNDGWKGVMLYAPPISWWRNKNRQPFHGGNIKTDTIPETSVQDLNLWSITGASSRTGGIMACSLWNSKDFWLYQTILYFSYWAPWALRKLKSYFKPCLEIFPVKFLLWKMFK